MPATPHAQKNPSPGFLALRRAMRLDVHDSARGAGEELARLRRLGLLEWKPRRLRWVLVPRHAPGLIDLLQGCAFHDAPGRRNPPYTSATATPKR